MQGEGPERRDYHGGVSVALCPECAGEYAYEIGALLVCPEGNHDIDCKVDGVGPMQLKSSVVEKV